VRATTVLEDAFGRIRDVGWDAVQGLTDEELTYRVDGETNTVAWLVWHLARVQDDHIAEVAESEQVWIEDGWVDRFGLPFDERAVGFGQDADEVAQVRVGPDLLIGYLGAVLDRTTEYLAGLSDDDLDRVVDDNWDPPVTLGVRLMSVIADDLQHGGQAALLRGILLRRRD
jgi:uncharacterized damage-inducible protein DinB